LPKDMGGLHDITWDWVGTNNEGPSSLLYILLRPKSWMQAH